MQSLLERAHAYTPFVTIKVGKDMEAATLLAEALGNAIFDQTAQLQVVRTYAVPLVVLFGLSQISLAAIHLYMHGRT